VIEKICAARLYASMNVDETDRTEGLSDDDLAELEQFCELTDQAMRAVLSRGKASHQWPELVQDLLMWSETCGHILDSNDPMFGKLVRDFAAVEKEAAARIQARNRGDASVTPALPPYRSATLSSLVEPYREFKAQRSQRPHVDACVHAWSLLTDHCGDLPFDAVTASHIFNFLHDRMRAAQKPWSERRALGFGKSALREAFGLARTSGLMTAPNPVDAMEVDPRLTEAEEAKHRKPRHPFTAAQLNKLFASSWYDPTNARDFRGKMQGDLGARYWVPLIGLFHGNRVREALQLTAGDLSHDGDIMLLTFQTEIDGDGAEGVTDDAMASLKKLRSLKNAATRRTVPVHPELLALGFAEFVEARKSEGPSALLFPSSMPEPGGQRPKLGRAYEQAFLRYVRDRLGFGSGFGNHSFRHQLEDRIRAAQGVIARWPPGLAQQYVGRTRTRDADREILLTEGSEAHYGAGYPARVVLEWIARLDVSDVRLPMRFSDWLNQRADA